MGKQRRRKRRSFSPEFKAETVRLVQGSEKSLGTIARELDLTETALRAWVRQAEVDAGRGRAGALTTDEREELARLRRGVKGVQMGRDILKKATGLFVKEEGGGSPLSLRGRPPFRGGACVTSRRWPAPDS